MDQYLGTGQIACGVVTVIGENGILAVVNLPGLDQFQIPLLGNFHYHRLQAMPFVEWISINQFGEEQEGLSALTDFISTHHLVPDLTESPVSEFSFLANFQFSKVFEGLIFSQFSVFKCSQLN